MTWLEATLGPVIEFLTIILILGGGAAISFSIITVIQVYMRKKRTKKLEEAYRNNWPRKKNN